VSQDTSDLREKYRDTSDLSVKKLRYFGPEKSGPKCPRSEVSGYRLYRAVDLVQPTVLDMPTFTTDAPVFPDERLVVVDVSVELRYVDDL